uniref:RNA-binding protein pno1-like n=1 Tax=Hirondellea gigas TaxID=1518452 RepID=A0A2P2I015_9CRUS
MEGEQQTYAQKAAAGAAAKKQKDISSGVATTTVTAKSLINTVKTNKVKTNTTLKEAKSINKKRKSDQMDIEPVIAHNGGEDIAEAPVFPADKTRKLHHREERKVVIPQHRVTPLKTNWLKITETIVKNLHLDIRYDPKLKQVFIRTTDKTEDTSSLQKAADFIQAFAYGFEVDDAMALLRLHDLYVETFDIKDVKGTLAGDHVGRAIGRLAGKGGKTRFTLENATKTRIILADSRVHILGAFANIAAVRRAICNLILGSPPSKVFGNLKAYADRICDRI